MTLMEIAERYKVDTMQLAVWVLESRDGQDTPLLPEEVAFIPRYLAPGVLSEASRVRLFDDIRKNWRTELRKCLSPGT